MVYIPKQKVSGNLAKVRILLACFDKNPCPREISRVMWHGTPEVFAHEHMMGAIDSWISYTILRKPKKQHKT